MEKNQSESHCLYIIQCIQEFIKDPKNSYLPDFFAKYQIPNPMFYDLVNNDPRVKNYFYYLRNVLASRNHKKLTTNKKMSLYEAQTCAYLMRKYDPNFVAINQLEKANSPLVHYEKTTDKNLVVELSPEMKRIYDANVERRAKLIAEDSKTK